MAWSGFREAAGESGLELSLGLPAYFSKPSGQAGLDEELQRVWLPAGISASRLHGPGSRETKLILVSLEPGCASPAAPHGSDLRPDAGNQSMSHCIPQARPGQMQATKRAGGGAFALQAKGSNGSKARPAAAPVVGWPPVRSFRRNLTSSSSKSSPQPSQNGRSKEDTVEAGTEKGLFVKINMDGVPIGRKVDLKAYGGYAELSAAVDKLFRGLLAAQRDPAAAADGEVVTAGVMDGSGEYTLVYEDDEADRMLVGDVPWEMFIATAKRLRVLKSSDIPASSLRAGSRKRAAADC